MTDIRLDKREIGKEELDMVSDTCREFNVSKSGEILCFRYLG